MAILILVAAITRGPVPQNVDWIELNHVLGESGEVRFSQIILWEWNPRYRRHDAIGWWCVELDSVSIPRTPQGYSVSYKGKHYASRQFSQSWTRHDPEVESRKLQGVKR